MLSFDAHLWTLELLILPAAGQFDQGSFFLVDECTSKEFRFHGDVIGIGTKVHMFTALMNLTLMVAPSLNKVSLSNNSFVHYKLFTPTHLPIVSCPKYTVYYPKTKDSERLTLN